MRVLIAPDKFKGSLSAMQVCEAIAHGIQAAHPTWQLDLLPLADGGEGTAQLLTDASGGKRVYAQATDPLGREIEVTYGLSPRGDTAFIEMAAASGLGLLQQHERNPMFTTTNGTGQVIKHAVTRGAKKVILGCGGSATNDGGLGMMQALGVQWLDSKGQMVQPIGKNLSQIASWKTENRIDISGIKFHLITDVRNPLYGPTGAAYTFGPQKGASRAEIESLDRGLQHVSRLFEENHSGFVANTPGSGAAGGLPVSARFFFDATLSQGIEFILEFIDAERKISSCDLVITGEGKLDATSLQGKAVAGVTALANRLAKPVWVVCGVNELGANQLQAERILSLVDIDFPVERAMQQAPARIAQVITNQLINGGP